MQFDNTISFEILLLTFVTNYVQPRLRTATNRPVFCVDADNNMPAYKPNSNPLRPHNTMHNFGSCVRLHGLALSSPLPPLGHRQLSSLFLIIVLCSLLLLLLQGSQWSFTTIRRWSILKFQQLRQWSAGQWPIFRWW